MSVTVKWHGRDISQALQQAAIGALRDGAEHILEEANRTIPHDEGTMQRTGTTSVDAAALQAAVSYDGPYTLKQHEDTRLRHPNGRRAKWLQLTLKERGKHVQEYIQKALRKAMSKGV